MTAPANFRKRDLEVALETIRKAGLEIARIEIERGRLILIAGKPGEPPQPVNPFDGAEL
jgi:hypothetical protein